MLNHHLEEAKLVRTVEVKPANQPGIATQLSELPKQLVKTLFQAAKGLQVMVMTRNPVKETMTDRREMTILRKTEEAMVHQLREIHKSLLVRKTVEIMKLKLQSGHLTVEPIACL